MPTGTIQDPDPPTGEKTERNAIHSDLRNFNAGAGDTAVGLGTLLCRDCSAAQSRPVTHVFFDNLGKRPFEIGNQVTFNHARFANTGIRVAINVSKAINVSQ